MKKILSLMILLCGSVAVAQSGYKSLVVEGRTWWYTSNYVGVMTDCDYGVRIGAEVDIDGVKWHKVEKVLSGNYPANSDVIIDSDNEVVELCYIREENGCVYTYVPEKGDFKPTDFYLGSLASLFAGDTAPVKVYDFGEVGEEWSFSNVNDEYNHSWIDYEITDISDTNSCGNIYRQYTAKFVKGDYNDYQDMTYVEGIGIRHEKYSELFVVPFDAFDMSYPFYDSPRLRYVTEGEDNTIIYEALGGRRIWEDSNGINGINADTSAGTPRYYNLQGIEVTDPSIPGIYIQVLNNSTSKVVVK